MPRRFLFGYANELVLGSRNPRGVKRGLWTVENSMQRIRSVASNSLEMHSVGVIPQYREARFGCHWLHDELLIRAIGKYNWWFGDPAGARDSLAYDVRSVWWATQ